MSSTERGISEFEISGFFLRDAAQIGTGFRLINTPEKDYPRLAVVALRQIRKQYEEIDKPVSDLQWEAVLNYYGLAKEAKLQASDDI